MMKTIAIIPARGGSKGIHRKNLVDVCGKPLIAWSILHANFAVEVDEVWVSSDDDEILEIAAQYGANLIKRPVEISGDEATTESALLHAIDFIDGLGTTIERVVLMQATSPLRAPSDLDCALRLIANKDYDSLMSVTEVEDFFAWGIDESGFPRSLNYDYRQRRRRQELDKTFLENGSFYIFSPDLLRNMGNRLGGRIGMYVMEFYKSFQIDNPEDIFFCSSIMSAYNLDKIAYENDL